MLMIFNLQEQGDDSMIWTIIIIVVSLSVIGIDFWLKSEKKKTIPKQKKRKIPRKRKVSYNSKEYEEWSSLRGSIKQRTPPMSWQLFRFNKSTFANLNQETWDALIKFDDGKISLNQLDEIYKKNEIKSDAKKTVKSKKYNRIMKVKIEIEGHFIDTNLDDLCQGFEDVNKDEIEEDLKNKGTYYGDYFELTLDKKSNLLNCELFLDSTAEILDWINNLNSVKGDEFILITRFYSYNVNTNDEYSEIESSGNYNFSTLLVGGIYDYKSIAREEETLKFHKAQEDNLIEGNSKYQDTYLVKSEDFNFENWLNNWLKDDNKTIDELKKNK